MTGNLWVIEDYIDATAGVRYGQSGKYESFTADRGELFRSCREAHGRCTGKVYIDRKDGTTRAIGWVFVRAEKTEDTGRRYLRETWITVAEPEDV